jgi:hypothetical protein
MITFQIEEQITAKGHPDLKAKTKYMPAIVRAVHGDSMYTIGFHGRRAPKGGKPLPARLSDGPVSAHTMRQADHEVEQRRSHLMTSFSDGAPLERPQADLTDLATHGVDRSHDLSCPPVSGASSSSLLPDVGATEQAPRFLRASQIKRLQNPPLFQKRMNARK